MSSHTTAPWFETLTAAERQDCEAELTDAYFCALSAGAWGEFRALVGLWTGRAAEKQLVTV